MEKAIEAIEAGGQQVEIEVSGDRRRVHRANLKDLYLERRRLLMAIRRQGGEGVSHAVRG
ncbi:hypothetical protein [Oligoflexus tunisiensis]|uniref:hypothetical protein n=1 Tax=Oligoflexus tunisiensis TaxID=708132 RepID=UPI001C408463|nr:hypothetical protein [Oligoflexus tunisiensis]